MQFDFLNRESEIGQIFMTDLIEFSMPTTSSCDTRRCPPKMLNLEMPQIWHEYIVYDVTHTLATGTTNKVHLLLESKDVISSRVLPNFLTPLRYENGPGKLEHCFGTQKESTNIEKLYGLDSMMKKLLT